MLALVLHLTAVEASRHAEVQWEEDVLVDLPAAVVAVAAEDKLYWVFPAFLRYSYAFRGSPKPINKIFKT